MIAWTLFVNPIALNADGWTLWLILPLCASVAITYKTIRTESLRRLPLEVIALMCYMMFGLIALGGVLWTLHTFWP